MSTKKVDSRARTSLIFPSKFSRIKVATMRMISAMLGKTKDIAKTENMLDTWNFGVENPVDSAKLKQLFPLPLPI